MPVLSATSATRTAAGFVAGMKHIGMRSITTRSSRGISIKAGSSRLQSQQLQQQQQQKQQTRPLGTTAPLSNANSNSNNNNNTLRRMYHSSTLSYRIHASLIQTNKQNHHHTSILTPRAAATSAFSLQPAATTTFYGHTKRWHGGPDVDHNHAESVHVTFVDADGKPLKEDVDAYVGESLLQVAQRNDIELEGACEGVCACSTCHVIFPDEDVFDNLLEEASEDEEDMLDMAYGLTETSRLGCQILVTDEMDEIRIQVPPATRNFYVDGHVPKPH